MAFLNRPHRRVNYKYLAKLDAALEVLGHSTRDIPVSTLRSPWPDIKDYIEDHLHLRVCGWCKLPRPNDEMAPQTSMCLEHLEQLQNSKGERLNLNSRTREGIRTHRKNTKFVEAMQQQLRDIARPETDNVGVSISEAATKPTAWDILDRAAVRSNDETGKDKV